MLFLIRTAFWLMIIVLLLPTDAQQQSEVYGTAQAAVKDVATFCDRNPETCARGKDAFDVFVQKAQFGARMLMGLINGQHRGRRRGRHRELRDAAACSSRRASTSSASQDTLNPEDREEAWSGPIRPGPSDALEPVGRSRNTVWQPPACQGRAIGMVSALSLPICAPQLFASKPVAAASIPAYIEYGHAQRDARDRPSFDEILADFELLDDWEDRYRYVIELGRKLEPLPEAERTAANKVQGCVSQVWLATHVDRERRRPAPDLYRRQRCPYRPRPDRHPLRALFGQDRRRHPRASTPASARPVASQGASDPAALERPHGHGGAHQKRRRDALGQRTLH